MRTPLGSRVIAIVTSTRADWGLLSPLARELQERGHRIPVIATGTHLDERFGMTIREIDSDGLYVAETVPVHTGRPASMASEVLEGVAKALRRLRPDCVIMLGDRYEILAAATAATVTGVPIVHVAGGTISEGAIDDNIRHAVTKLSTLHLVETRRCQERVLQMGENPNSVYVTGALGVHNIMATKRMSREELEENLQWKFGKRNLLATLHAETRGVVSPLESMHNFLYAVEDLMAEDPDLNVIMTYPNNDVAAGPQIELMTDMERKYPERFRTVPSLGRVRYMSVLDIVDAMAGNSSSGIVEVPSAGVPVLDIGIRQRGREHGPGVFHCDSDRKSILEGLRYVFSDVARAIAARRDNPYAMPDTPSLMADAIEETDFRPFPIKKFTSIQHI